MRKLPNPLPLASADPNAITFSRIRTSPPGGMYVFEHLLYDQVIYPAAGGAGLALPAFGNTARGGDATVSNWPNSGQLPKPHKFHGLYLFATPVVETTMAGAVDGSGRLRDVERVFRMARTVVEFDLAATGRKRPPIPLLAVPSLPGVRGVVAPGTAAAQNPIQSVQGIGSGDGYPLDLPLDEGETFGITLRTKGDAAVAISADLPIQLSVFGWYYMQAG